MILYLHGFRSSPLSHKSQALARHLAQRGLAERFQCPQLPVAPSAAIALAENIIASSSAPVTLIGSSLGGYYATYLAEKHDLRAVLVNPAVVAHLSLAEHLGRQTNLYTGEEFDFTWDHVHELEALEVPTLSKPERYWLMVETGDEVLDYRQAVERYRGARQTVLQGGDHSFTRWGDYLDDIVAFANLRPAS